MAVSAPVFGAGLLLAAYLLGSLSGSLILGRLIGVDIRKSGSGNAGGTNALRTRGWRFALGVVAIDVGKGVLAALLPLAVPLESALVWPLQAACGMAAAAGHVWPVFFGFRGGKGAGTLIGALAVVWPVAAVGVVAVWLLVLFSTGYVGLSTVLAAAALVPLALLGPEIGLAGRLTLALIASGFIAFTHRDNLRRLCAGTGYRFEKARLFARLRRAQR